MPLHTRHFPAHHPSLVRDTRKSGLQAEDDVQGTKLKLKQYEQPGELITLPSGMHVARFHACVCHNSSKLSCICSSLVKERMVKLVMRKMLLCSTEILNDMCMLFLQEYSTESCWRGLETKSLRWDQKLV
jgi:hypothetical protein